MIMEEKSNNDVTLSTPKKKGTWGGVRPGAGRPKVYEGKLGVICLSASESLLQRLTDESRRTGLSKSYLFSEWLKTLPESVIDKTQAMQDAYLKKKVLKNL